MSAVITPFEGTELFNTASFNNRISQINTGFSYVSNPNLLDNWYFGRPVNQRGKTSYRADWIYTIDRWQVSQNTTLTVNNGSVSSIGEYSFEPLDEIVDALRGRTVTISLLFASGELEFATGVVPTTWGSWDNFALSSHVGLQGIGEDSKRLWFMINGNAENILAAKLEIGPGQTLAHREGDKWVLNEIPDYGEQLRRCQRYFVRFGYPDKYCALAMGQARTTGDTVYLLPIPVTMRTMPSAILYGSINFRYGDIYSSATNFSIEVNGKSSLLCASSVTAPSKGAACDIFLLPLNYLDISADL